MKQFSTFNLMLCLFVTILGIHDLAGQTVFWTEAFSNGCAFDCPASSYGGWTVQNNTGGTSGSNPNLWYVSCAEEGITPPGCGSSCISDQTLHIGNDPGSGGDMGASYNETAAVNATYSLAVSPTINATGYSSITLNFDFIAYGSAACSEDRAQLWLSTDNGATWPAGYKYCLNAVCCGACNGYSQGQWTLYTLALPAAFDNNPNIRIGFQWINNGNGSGTDPSVAIDDIRLSVTAMPLELLNFSGRKTGKNIALSWNTQSEINVSHFEVERALDDKLFKAIGQLPAKGNNMPGKHTYTYQDEPPVAQHLYYRLKITDFDGTINYSNIIHPMGSANTGTNSAVFSILSAANDVLNYQVTVQTETTVNLSLFDIQGKNVLTKTGIKLNKGDNKLSAPIPKLPAGLYLASIDVPNNPNMKLAAKFVVSP